MTVIEHT